MSILLDFVMVDTMTEITPATIHSESQQIHPSGFNRGRYFDLAAFIMNFALVPPLVKLVRDSQGFHPLFGFLLIAAFFFHAAGAWLKRFRLSNRLSSRGSKINPKKSSDTFFMIGFFILCIMHYGLFMAIFIFGSEIFLGEKMEGTIETIVMIAVLALGWVPTALTLFALVKPRKPVEMSWRMKPSVELAGDALIWFSIFVIFAWWEGVFVETLSGATQGNLAAGILLTILVTVPFAMFYLSPRLVYLAEDYRTPATWIQILAVMLPLAYRIIF